MLNRIAVCLSVLLLATTGCTRSGTDAPNPGNSTYSGEYPIDAVATIGMVGDIVRNVGGEHVKLNQICGSGVDPHLYKPTRDDVKAILDSNIVFYSGLLLEGKMGDTLVKVARKKPVFAVTENIDESKLLQPEEFEGHFDPHVWNDVSAWRDCVSVVENALVEFDPKHAEQYKANSAAYQKKLSELHEYGKQVLGTIPEGRRVLMTSHDAFNYFGRAYGLQVEGVQGLSTESEAGIRRINELVDMLVKQNVKAVFVESSVSKKNIEALVEGAKSRGHDVVVGGELFSDAMGKGGTYEGTYIGMLDHNITLVATALGGDAKEKGLNGKLSDHSE